jgi:hypothetical protein
LTPAHAFVAEATIGVVVSQPVNTSTPPAIHALCGIVAVTLSPPAAIFHAIHSPALPVALELNIVQPPPEKVGVSAVLLRYPPSEAMSSAPAGMLAGALRFSEVKPAPELAPLPQ